MKRQLIACLTANLKFAGRNRLPLALAGLFLGWMLLTLLPVTLLAKSVPGTFLLNQTIRYLHGWGYVVTAAVALLTVSHHLQNRSLKMVITKPCPIEIWLLANFFSSAAIAVCLYGVVLALGVGLSLLWKIPLQPGLFFVTLDEFFRAVILSSYLILLVSLFHPVIAVMVALLLQEDQFYWLTVLASRGLEASPDAHWHGLLLAFKRMSQALYEILPSFEPFAKQTAHIRSTLSVGGGDIKYLGYTALYTACFASFCFLISVWILRQRRHT